LASWMLTVFIFPPFKLSSVSLVYTWDAREARLKGRVSPNESVNDLKYNKIVEYLQAQGGSEWFISCSPLLVWNTGKEGEQAPVVPKPSRACL
jgi:hypothetical protein